MFRRSLEPLACHEPPTHGNAETLVLDILAAMDAHGIDGDWTAGSLALHTKAVIEGRFILAKASGDSCHAIEAMGFHEGWGKAANQFEELAKTL